MAQSNGDEEHAAEQEDALRAGDMAASQICKRVEKVMWQQDKRGFLTLANGECSFLRVFVTSFERDNAERATRAPAPIPAQGGEIATDMLR